MALEVATGSITDPGSTGQQSYSGLGFEPKVVLFFGKHSSTYNSTENIHADCFGVGISSSNRYAVAQNARYGTFDIHDTGTNINQDVVLVSSWVTGNAITKVDLVSLDSDGFTLDWVTRNATWPQQGFYIALGGDDLEDVSLDLFQGADSTGDKSFSGVGFQPDAVLLGISDMGGALNRTNTNRAVTAFGMADGAEEVCLTNAVDDGGTNAYSRAYDGRVVSIVNESGNEESQATLSSFDSDGFTLNFSDATTGEFNFFALSLKGPSIKIGKDAQPTSTGTKATSGVGFLPRGVLLSSIAQTSGTSIHSNCHRSFGSGSNALWTRAANGSTDKHSYAADDSILRFHSDTGTSVDAVAELDSLDSDGFTLDWTTADSTEREFFYLALGDADDPLDAEVSSNVTLSHESIGFLDILEVESTLVLSQDSTAENFAQQNPSNAIGFMQESTGVVLAEQDADNTVVLSHEAVAGGFLEREASSNLVVDHTLGVQQPIDAEAENTVSLSTTAVSSGVAQVDAESTIELQDLGHAADEFDGIASQTIDLVSEVAHIGPKSGVASNTIILTATGDTTTKSRFPSQSLTLAHATQANVSKGLKHTLNLTQTVDRSLRVTSSSQLLTLAQTAEAPHSSDNSLTLVQTLGVILPNASQFANSALTLAQTAQSIGDKLLAASNTLGLVQTPSYSTNVPTRFCKYTPFIGGGSMPPTIPPADDVGFTQGLKLEHGMDSLTISRSMSYGDIDRLVFDRINRTSRGGTLLVFADPIWPKLESLVFTVSAVKKDEAQGFLDFIEPRIGQQMTLTTHEGRQWQGIITNPQDAVIQDARESYTLSIEFQGSEI